MIPAFPVWGKSSRLHAAGLDLSPPVEELAMVKGRYRHHLMLGYGHLGEAEIEAGVALLRQVLE